jgi:xylulokinase
MDNRAVNQMNSTLSKGIKIDGVNILKLLKSLIITGVVASSSKDPVWKYKWVKDNEPYVFSNVYKWLDVKEFLISKSCGEFIMTEDSAFSTMLFDIKKRKFSKSMCKMLGVNPNHLPKIIKSTDIAGKVTAKAAAQLGLSEGIPIFGGGGDASLIGIGSGATKPGNTHIYIGTSGWVSTVIEAPKVDVFCKIAGLVGANSKTYNYFAELETAGKCIEWVKEHLAYEETISEMEKSNINGDYEDIAVDLYDYMMESIKSVPAGSRDVMFTPWLHGNRCPFEDTGARGMFFNIGIDTKKTELIHSVIEGVCYHLKWQLECSQKKVAIGNKVRFVGGGALAPMTCQILSDIIGLDVEVIKNPQNAGAMGAAIITAVGLGVIDGLDMANDLIEVELVYSPNTKNRKVYKKGFDIFKSLYYNNKKAFGTLNS